MNIERLQMKGLLSEYRQKVRKLDTEASGLIILIRTYISPYEDDLTKLQTEKALSAIEKLHSTIQELKEIKQKVQTLEEDLG